ncbi:hypothetical protein SVAN01_10759 [Stagonosporopsis vannaccii]|nr:hypothetical protein SVAN01_10759 [Stagonosporopsis vannaccii]
MAGDWPRAPRAYGSPQHSDPPAPVRTLPSVAELLSSRPSANSPIPAYHRHDYFHAHSSPPAASLAPVTAANTTTSSYWNAVNHRQTSPPVSPTEQRPASTPAAARDGVVGDGIVRVYHEPTFRRQQVSKQDPAFQHSALSSGLHNASHSTGQARQDSAIDQHRFETRNDAQLSKANVSYFHQSPKDGQRLPSPTLSSYQPASTTSTNAPIPVSHQGEGFVSQPEAHLPARQHSKSLSSGATNLVASLKSHEDSTERIVPVDIKNGTDPRQNITGPSSLPEQFFTQQNTFGTRQQRYNVRFAANYTSENMPPSQKPRNEPPTPPSVPAAVSETEEPRSSPMPTPVTDEATTSAPNGNIRQSEAHPRALRETRDRSEREPSVERCVGCNEAWRRPIPDMDQDDLAPAETNADYMRLASNMIDRLRDQRKKVDAAYEDWKWRHSHCYRPMSPHSTGSMDEPARRPDTVTAADGLTNGNATNKRKSEIPHELNSASKQRRVTSTSPAPPARKPDLP